jgi:hypothetical protein
MPLPLQAFYFSTLTSLLLANLLLLLLSSCLLLLLCSVHHCVLGVES